MTSDNMPTRWIVVSKDEPRNRAAQPCKEIPDMVFPTESDQVKFGMAASPCHDRDKNDHFIDTRSTTTPHHGPKLVANP